MKSFGVGTCIGSWKGRWVVVVRRLCVATGGLDTPAKNHSRLCGWGDVRQG